MPLFKCNNILVVRTDRIGDLVLTSPVFKALRQAYPAARICVLTVPTTADLVRGNPYVDDVIVDDRDGAGKGALGALRLARAIRQQKFDTAFIFHTKRRYNMACFLAGIPCRVGYKNDKFGVLLTHPAKDTRHLGEKHEAEYCLDLLASVGIDSAGLDLLVPVQKEADTWAMQWFQTQGLMPGEFIVVHGGASDLSRRWPAASFARLINALTARYNLKVVLIGGHESADASAEILRLSGGQQIIDMTGQTTVAQMAALLRRSRLLISNDSGPLHVGAGVGIPVISLFLRNQPGLNPARWRPLGPKAFMLTNKAGEEVILDRQGAVGKGRQDSITVEEVLDLVEDILRQDSQSLFYW